MQYAPGDSIGVLPQNDPALVAALLERLGLEGDAVFSVVPAGEGQAVAATGAAAAANGGAVHDSSREHLLPHLGAPCSVCAALSRGVDLTGPPRKSLLRLLAEHCGEATERRRLLHLCSRDGREEYATDMLAGRPSLLQLLRQFPSCRPPLDALLDALPPLAARMYSLSCSPLECPGKVGNLCCLPALPCLSLRLKWAQLSGIRGTVAQFTTPLLLPHMMPALRACRCKWRSLLCGTVHSSTGSTRASPQPGCTAWQTRWPPLPTPAPPLRPRACAFPSSCGAAAPLARPRAWKLRW
jgi:hypothetical protein